MKRFGMGKAKELFTRAFGSCKGIEYLYDRKPDEYGSGYEMQLGELEIRAVHTAHEQTVLVEVSANCLPGTLTMVFDGETYERDFAQEDIIAMQHRKDLFADWVTSHSPEYCCEKVKIVWEECS